MKTLIGAACAALMLCVASTAQAADIDAHDIKWHNHDKTQSVAQDAGHYVMVHFWASWCQPCRDEMPKLAAWAKAHPNIVFVPISLDDTRTDAAHFLKADHLTGVPLLMGTIDDATQIGVRAIPLTMIIDPEGHVIRTIHGASPWGKDAFSHSVLKTISYRGTKEAE